jgi:hypothetical protein
MLTMSVTLTGPIFNKVVRGVFERAVEQEIFDKVYDRTKRGGKGLGARLNTVTRERAAVTDLVITSTKIFPRTKGTSWKNKNIRIIRAMSGAIAKKAARRITQELG